MNDREIHSAIRILRREVPKWDTPVVTLMAETYESPFRVLISCILSLRTQDATTAKASHRLFAIADSPSAMVKLSARKLEKIIYPVGFYKTKARNILDICRTLIDQYRGKVPDEIDELLKLKGVGRKTANLVVTLGYKKPGICVDTHVHRISNRWGYVKTKTPGENRGRAESQTSQAILDRIQRSPGQLRSASLPADLTAVQRMPGEKYCRQIGVTVRR